jgi:hypothetical protein
MLLLPEKFPCQVITDGGALSDSGTAIGISKAFVLPGLRDVRR